MMMRSLKMIVVFAILLLGGLVVDSCGSKTNKEPISDEKGQTVENDTVQNVVLPPLDVKDGNAVLDSIKQINKQVATLELNGSKQYAEIKALTAEIEKLRKKSVLSILIAWGIGIISLIMAIWGFVKAKVAMDRSERHREEIEGLKRKLYESEARFANNTRNRESAFSRIQSGEYADLSSRINRLERKLENQSYSAKSVLRVDNDVVNRQTESNEQHGFFRLPSKMSEVGAYFKYFDEVRNSDSRFSVIVKNGLAEFRPLGGTQYLNDLKGSDSIKMALDIQGCIPSEIVQLTVIEPGEATSENGRWVIIKKVKVKLA